MFKFIRKLFKALNSSGKAWQLSGSIVLAMFAGFLPLSSFILLGILFLALVLNINFGLFFLFSAIFSAVGYLFDPIFEYIGYFVLTSEGLSGFFTSLYNITLFRWSGFNYTLVTGSLVVSLVLALPMLLILNRVITVYRKEIGAKLNEWRFTRWMNLFNEEAKSISFFRWWGVGVFGGLVAAIAIVFVLIFDPLARVAIEKSLSYSLQTQVTVKDFSSSFLNLNVNLSGIEVADKDKLTHNLIQIGDVEFDFDFSALIEKKAMIEKLSVVDLAFNKQRKITALAYDDSYISEDRSSQKNSVDKMSASKLSDPLSLPNIDDILAKEDLKCVIEAQNLKEDIENTRAKWTKISMELKSSNEIEEIKKDATTLQKNLKGADFTKIASAKSDIDKLNSKISSLKSKYTSLQKDFKADQTRIEKQIYELKNFPGQDFDRLKKKYSLDATGGANLISTLMSGEIKKYFNTGLKYYEMLRPYINDGAKDEPKKVTPPRGQGRWIKYVNLSSIPDLVIKDSIINLKLKEDILNINVKDLSSNQKLYAKPMVIHADAKGIQYKYIVADVVDDRRNNSANTSFKIKAKEFKIPTFNMKSINMNDITIDATFKGEIEELNIKTRSNLDVKKVKLQMPSQEIVNDLLSGISKFNVDISMDGDIQKPVIEVKSDLDKQLSSGMKSMVSNATKVFESNLKDGVMKKAFSSSDGISADLGDTGALIDSKQNSLGSINTNFTPSIGGAKLPSSFF